MKRLILSAFIILCLLMKVWGKQYHIHSQEEFLKIAGKVKPGDKIIFANGRYSGIALTLPFKGSVLNPIIVTAETPDSVIFSGDVSNSVFSIEGENIVVEGMVFEGCNLIKSEGHRSALVELKNSSKCRLTRCTFVRNKANVQFSPLVIISGNGVDNRVDSCRFIGNEDNQEVQIKITKDSCPQYTLIEKNVFKDKPRVSWPVFNGGECIQIGQDPVLLGNSEPKAIVRENRFIHCNGEPEVISNKSSGNCYIRNYFEGCQGELVMRGGHGCLIDSNIINGGGGIRINGTEHIVSNNTICGVKTAIRLMYGMARGRTEIGFYIAASHCIIKNNKIERAETGILAGDGKNIDWTGKFDIKRYPSGVLQNVPPSDNIIENNLFYDTKSRLINN